MPVAATAVPTKSLKAQSRLRRVPDATEWWEARDSCCCWNLAFEFQFFHRATCGFRAGQACAHDVTLERKIRNPGEVAMRARFALFLFLFLFSIPALSQGQKAKPWNSLPKEAEAATRAFPPQLRNELAQIRDAALADDYAYKQLEHLTDSIGPRPQGSPQADAASQYVAGELRKLGLDVHLESVPVHRFQRGTDTAELVDYPGHVDGAKQRIFVTALLGNSPTPDAGITADVVVVRSFDELKALGKDKIAGKIVLFNFVYDHRKAVSGQAGAAYGEAVRYRAAGAGAAADLGAAASLVRSAGDGGWRLPHTGWSA